MSRYNSQLTFSNQKRDQGNFQLLRKKEYLRQLSSWHQSYELEVSSLGTFHARLLIQKLLVCSHFSFKKISSSFRTLKIFQDQMLWLLMKRLSGGMGFLQKILLLKTFPGARLRLAYLLEVEWRLDAVQE